MSGRSSLPRGKAPAKPVPPGDQTATPIAEPSAGDVPVPLVTSETIGELASRLRAVITRELGRLESTSTKLTESDRRNNLKTATNALKDLATITGELKEVPDSKLIKLPGFRRVLDRTTLALTPWPEAMRAVGMALKELADE